MDPTVLQHAITLIRERKTPLICLPKNASSDAIAGGLGLYLALGKMGKRPKVVSPGFTLPPGHSFLPKSDEILTDVAALKKFIITVDTAKAPLEELSYDIVGQQLHVYLTPKQGVYEAKDISTASGSYSFDLVITLDAPNLESFGRLFDDNRDFFYHTPIINIDHNPANGRFGQIALVDLTASSTSELIFELLEASKEQLIDEYAATALLAGMISKTKSFQTPTVTPRSLAVASYLITSGARREEIIRNLYQTKSLSVLKLWGRALMRLQSSLGQQVVWTTLSAQDFKDSGGSLRDVPGVIDELIANTAGAEAIIVLAEERGATRVFLSTGKRIDAMSFFSAYKPEGSRHFITFNVEEPASPGVLAELRTRVEQFLQAG